MRRNSMVLVGVIGFFVVLSTICTVSFAGGGSQSPYPEAYIQGGWKFKVSGDTLDKTGEEEDIKASAYLIISDYEKDEWGGFFASISAYSDKKMSKKVGSGEAYPNSVGNSVSACVGIKVSEGVIQNFCFSAFVTGIEIYGRFLSEKWEPSGIFSPEGYEYWIRTEINSGDASLKRIF